VVNLLVKEPRQGQKEHAAMNTHEEGDPRASQAAGAVMPNNVAKELVQLFKLLSDETRLRILFFLRQQDELHVRALCELLHQSQPAVSHHLALLRVAGLIRARRDGKHNFYRILPKRFNELTHMFFAVMPNDEDSEPDWFSVEQ